MTVYSPWPDITAETPRDREIVLAAYCYLRSRWVIGEGFYDEGAGEWRWPHESRAVRDAASGQLRTEKLAPTKWLPLPDDPMIAPDPRYLEVALGRREGL